MTTSQLVAPDPDDVKEIIDLSEWDDKQKDTALGYIFLEINEHTRNLDHPDCVPVICALADPDKEINAELRGQAHKVISLIINKEVPLPSDIAEVINTTLEKEDDNSVLNLCLSNIFSGLEHGYDCSDFEDGLKDLAGRREDFTHTSNRLIAAMNNDQLVEFGPETQAPAPA